MSVRVVGFDGTPVAGGSGARAAIFDTGDGDLVTSGRRRVTRPEFALLADEGYATRVDLDAPATDRVVVYQTPTSSGLDLTLDGVRWAPCGEYEVAALTRVEATQVLTTVATSRRIRAMLAWEAGRGAEALRLAREGLMAVPGLRSSPLAADLYAVLYADAFGNAKRLALTRREMDLTLDPLLRVKAISTGNALRLARTRPPRSRLIERAHGDGFMLR